MASICSRFKKRSYLVAVICVFTSNCLCMANAAAAPEEIQIYLDEFSEPGKYGLDVHANFVASDRQNPLTPAQSTNHQLRVTPEFSYGINSNWELAAYLLTVKDAGETVQTDGVKVRAKWRPQAPSANSAWYWALNFEVGQLSRRYYPDQTSGEIKLITVWRTDPWLVGVNFNLDRSLKSTPLQGATLEIDSELAYRINDNLQIGIENYAYRGELHNNTNLPESNQKTFLTTGLILNKWDLNLGMGYASGQTTDKLLIKAIIGVPF
jgi:hypothetical protein